MSNAEPLDEEGLTPIEVALHAGYYNEICEAYEVEDIPCSIEREDVYTGPKDYVPLNEMYDKFMAKCAEKRKEK